MRISDWSSDVCSSDLQHVEQEVAEISGVQRLQPLLIGPVQRLAAPIGIGKAFVRRQIGGRPAAVLPFVDQARQQPRRKALFIDIGRSEEHTSELQSLMRISYAVFFLKKKTTPSPLDITSLPT